LLWEKQRQIDRVKKEANKIIRRPEPAHELEGMQRGHAVPVPRVAAAAAWVPATRAGPTAPWMSRGHPSGRRLVGRLRALMHARTQHVRVYSVLAVILSIIG